MTWSLEHGTAQLANLSHVGIVVRDAESTTRFVSSIWNIGTPEVIDYWPTDEERIVGGSFGLRAVFIQLGPVVIELIQPLDETSVWARFLAERGEGLHHLAFGVSNYDEMVETMSGQGHELLVSAIHEGRRWCYFDTHPGGAVIEFRDEYVRS
jgi:catechol 2,3-dioxygenase-like lactoylglutathione lyase family enzyme